MRTFSKTWAPNSGAPGTALPPTTSHCRASHDHHLSYTRITKNWWKNIILPTPDLHKPRSRSKNVVQNHWYPVQDHYVPPRNRIVPLKNHPVPPRNHSVPLKNRSAPLRNHSVPPKNHFVPPGNRTVPRENHCVPVKKHTVPLKHGKYP